MNGLESFIPPFVNQLCAGTFFDAFLLDILALANVTRRERKGETKYFVLRFEYLFILAQAVGKHV